MRAWARSRSAAREETLHQHVAYGAARGSKIELNGIPVVVDVTSERRHGLDDEAGARARFDRPIVVRGAPDPGNRITVICACESALARVLDRDALPPSRGVLTPSVAFGARIVKPLRGAGVRLE